MSTATLRLIATPDLKRPGRFTARLESTGEEIVSSSRQPFVDGARELLGRDFDPSTPLTMRLEGKTYDSLKQLPIGEWARWTYTEPDKRGLKAERWMPFPGAGIGQKSGSEPPEVPEGQETENRFHGGPRQQPATVLGAA